MKGATLGSLGGCKRERGRPAHDDSRKERFFLFLPLAGGRGEARPSLLVMGGEGKNMSYLLGKKGGILNGAERERKGYLCSLQKGGEPGKVWLCVKGGGDAIKWSVR